MTSFTNRLEKVYVQEIEALGLLKQNISVLCAKQGMSRQQALSLLRNRQEHFMVPVSIFKNVLSPLENLAWYAHHALGLNITQTGLLLGRDSTTIWTTIQHAKKKKHAQNIHNGLLVPLSIFNKKKLSVLESLAWFLHKEHKMKLHGIAIALGKDDRTIWTVVSRAKKKRGTR